MKLSKIASLLNPINLIKKINDLIDVARSPLKRSTAYVIGDIVHVYALPSNLYLECTQAGVTSFISLNLSEKTVGAELTDGTVKWIVRDKNDVIRKSGVASVGSENIPVFFDANGNAQTTKNFNNYLPLAGGTMSGAIIYSGNGEIKLTTDNSYTVVRGSNANENGGQIILYGKNYSADAVKGSSRLQGSNGTNTFNLTVTPTNATITSTPIKSSNDTSIATTKFVKDNLADYVPTSRTINNKALSSNITLTANDVGALSTLGTISKNSNGYMKFTNGLIIQWGKHQNTSATHSITFPTAFTSTNYSVTANFHRSTDVSNEVVSCYTMNTSATACTIYADEYPNGLGSATHTVEWIAIGY